MCGIFGAFSKKEDLEMQTIINATNTLSHRGPDDRQVWLSQNRKVGLGHTRLSIIDLEGGVQPLTNEDGTIRAVVNGEIYDFERMRAELQEKGHRFKTFSDSEVLIHLYEEIGLDALQKLRGEYAFILWDEKTQRMIAARDRFGIKPLYFSFYNSTLFFASEIKALLAAGVPAEWDEESFYVACHLGFTPMQDRTLFKGIFQISPGYVVVADKSQQRICCYWDFDYPLSRTTSIKFSEHETISTFRSYFEEAVKLRLRADVPVGVYLSGGLDSCSILGTAAKFKGAGIKAYTIGFDDAPYDETSVAREMAEFAGAQFNPLMITQQDLAKNFIESIWHCETIVINPHSVAKYILSKTVRDSGYKVVLTGEGSDEILGGYPHFRQDILLNSKEYRANNSINSLQEELIKKNLFSLDLALDEIEDNNIIKRRLGFVPSWIKGRIASSQNIKKLFSDNMKSKFSDYDAYGVFLDEINVKDQLQGRHVLNQSLYLWSKLMLPNYLLCSLGDRMEMAHSVEGRVPFLDHKLVEFATTLPESYKIRNMTEKYILREAAKPVITKTVYERKKHPFVAPPTTKKIDEPMFKFISQYIGDNLNSLPFFDKKSIAKYLKDIKDNASEKSDKTDAFIMSLASIVALQQQFNLARA